MPRQRTFFMPPAHTPEAAPTEQKGGVDVYTVLRDHLKYVELIHNELHRQRRSNQELAMKVSELSSKVDNLISVATDIKSRADANTGGSNSGAPVMGQPSQEDDPEVQRLADRIDEAVRILKGEAEQQEAVQSPPATEPPANQFDPNSPVSSEPSPEALATDINSPQARDPNAPV
jgi:hypothetical protein